MANERDELLLSVLNRNAADPEVQKLIEIFAGQPVMLEAKNGKNAISFEWLVGLFNSPILKSLLPLIIAVFTGGLSSATLIPLIIKVIQQLLGVSESTAKAMLLQSLQRDGGA